MKLNLNFDGFTKLRDWWNTVRSNFEIIEDECNKTRKIADNACTKEEARAYINEFIGLSDDYMAAIEAFTELYKENESTVAAMDEVYGSRLKYYSKEEVFDANEAVAEDAIFFCKAETENTPSNQTGILISKTDNKQMWIAENGEIFYRQFADDVWGEWESSLDKTKSEIKSWMEDYQIPWNVSDNLGKININSSTIQTSTAKYPNDYNKKSFYMFMKNSGDVYLDFSLWFESNHVTFEEFSVIISVLINDKEVASYTTMGDFRTLLSVVKGDIVTITIKAKTLDKDTITATLTLNDINLVANVETAYTYNYLSAEENVEESVDDILNALLGGGVTNE